MKRLRFIIILLALLIAGLAAVLIFSPGELKYNGKTVTQWLFQALRSQNSSAEWQDSQNALHAIGTNALPTLLKLSRAKDGKLRTAMINLVDVLDIEMLRIRKAGQKREAAFYGLQFLTTTTLPVSPELARMPKYESKTNRIFAIRGLAEYGADKKALAAQLAYVLKDEDPNFRYQAAWLIQILIAEDARRLGIYEAFPSLMRQASNVGVTNLPSAK